jgi:hypothetical protein
MGAWVGRDWLPLPEFRMFRQEGKPLVVTIRVSFVSAVKVGSSDPLEQPLAPDDYSSQRTDEEPIPNADDNDRDGVHARPSDCDVSLTYETRRKTPACSILHAGVAFWRKCDTANVGASSSAPSTSARLSSWVRPRCFLVSTGLS